MKAEKTTGELIKAARKKAGLTQAELGAKLGITPAAISQFEKPSSNPTFDTLEKIANALSCKISDLCEYYDTARIKPNITPEEMEWFKFKAEVTQKVQTGEALISEEQQKIIDYENQKEEIAKREAAKNAPKFIIKEEPKKHLNFFNHDKKKSITYDGKPPKFTDRSTSFEESKAQEEAHNLIDSIPNEEPLSWEREKIALQLRDILSTYSELNDAGREAAVKRIEELRYSDVMTDSRLDDIYFNRVKKKINKGVKLSSDEIEWWHNYLDKSVKTVGAIFESLFSMLNEEGRRKAHTQINRAIDQIEMLTKIPEYQKDTDTSPQE